MKEIQRILDLRNIGFWDETVANCVHQLLMTEKPIGRFWLDITTALEDIGLDEKTKFQMYKVTVRLIEEGEKTDGAKD